MWLPEFWNCFDNVMRSIHQTGSNTGVQVQNRDYVGLDAIMVVTLQQESRKERGYGDHDPCWRV
jgi:hypothetical protein